MTLPTVRTCPTCGYTRSYTSDAQADRHHLRHSCDGQLARADAARRRAAGRTLRPCPHTPPHLHGTRPAYVKDTCRCAPCTAANSRAEHQRAKAAAYGRDPSYVDADPARRHLQHLTAAGIGLRRISHLTGVPHGTLARLRYGDSRNGRRPSRRIRPRTEAAILAVHAAPHTAAPGSLLNATGTRRNEPDAAALARRRHEHREAGPTPTGATHKRNSDSEAGPTSASPRPRPGHPLPSPTVPPCISTALPLGPPRHEAGGP